MENHNFSWENDGKLTIFNGHFQSLFVSLPEGKDDVLRSSKRSRLKSGKKIESMTADPNRRCESSR